ncbi:hypothetical protein RHMOL_Rhmol11G0059500 [Rhododendron molle]|uniref:Uncharacterized protein n=1 Tax=Rhododendron molle TaxID=49168 RepID=A0ACC0LQT8_RHOML|nr:hypothetical protein RHMOL_Rhmol11G0059500 [Rhododendron molle]
MIINSSKEATDGFSDLNFLAEGGFGTAHRGVLRDGQVVAVKQLKSIGSKGDTDFCREVRVLSCAQHMNVVLLIGFCVEGKNQTFSLRVCMQWLLGLPFTRYSLIPSIFFPPTFTHLIP